MEKQSEFGVGPITIIPGYLAIIFLWLFADEITILSNFALRIVISLALLIIGIAFVYFSASSLKLAQQSENLNTNGIYSISRNPMYCGHLCFIQTGLAVLSNNWYCFFSVLLSFSLFKLFIKKEEQYLNSVYAEEYVLYCKHVKQFLPLPRLRA